jgi:hypothetical protein
MNQLIMQQPGPLSALPGIKVAVQGERTSYSRLIGTNILIQCRPGFKMMLIFNISGNKTI